MDFEQGIYLFKGEWWKTGLSGLRLLGYACDACDACYACVALRSFQDVAAASDFW